MKQLIPTFSLALLMAACSSHPNTDVAASTAPQPVQQAPISNVDTAGLAQFQQWKAANELASATQYTTAVKNNPKVYAAPQQRSSNHTAAPNRSSTASGNTDGGTMSSESSNTAKAAQKRGWSKAAKGTAIGAGAGAVAGAVINKKNRVVGGVIGGVLGGAVGYGIGHHMDKQDGRY